MQADDIYKSPTILSAYFGRYNFFTVLLLKDDIPFIHNQLAHTSLFNINVVLICFNRIQLDNIFHTKHKTMKKLLITTLICLIITKGLFAQDCLHYLYLQKDKIIEMTGYSKKGDVLSKTSAKVIDVKTAGGTATANVVTDIFDKNGKQLGTTNTDYKCDGSSVSVQMHFDGDKTQDKSATMNINVTGNMTEQYPLDMKVGDHLKDYTSQVQMIHGTTATVKVTDRIVEAKENLTTPAGTWECFRISYKSTITTTVAKSSSDTANKFNAVFNKLGIKPPSSTNETTIWYVPGFAVIKILTKNGYIELTGLK